MSEEKYIEISGAFCDAVSWACRVLAEIDSVPVSHVAIYLAEPSDEMMTYTLDTSNHHGRKMYILEAFVAEEPHQFRLYLEPA